MNLIAIKKRRQYAKKKKEAERSLFAWYEEASMAKRKNPGELKEQFRAAAAVSDRRVLTSCVN